MAVWRHRPFGLKLTIFDLGELSMWGCGIKA